MTYPPADRQPVVDHLHGQAVPDPYRWLEDVSTPETRKWQAAQDDLWRRYSASLPGRDRLRRRVAELTEVGTITAPLWRGDRRFILRQEARQEHPVLYAAEPDGGERVLVDPMTLDPTGATTLDDWQPDLDGRLLAYQLSRHGDERSVLYVLDVDTLQVVDGPIDRCRYSPVAWLPGGDAFFFVRAAPDDERSRRVYLHRVGSPATADVLIFAASRAGYSSIGLGASRDGRWLTVSAAPGPAEPNDLWLADLSSSPPGEPDLRVVQQGVGARTALDVGRDGRMYLLTTLGAPRGRLCVADPAHPGPDLWRDLVPADPEAVLSDFAILDGADLERAVLIVTWIRHALSEVSVHDLVTGERLAEAPLPGAGSIGPLATRPTGGHEAWFTYTDDVTPEAVYRYDAGTGETSLSTAAPGAVAVPDTRSHQVVYASADGTPVRMVVLAQPSDDDRPRPTILYGYGGFGVPLIPTYSSFSLAWVEAGGVFALAHLRGGGEEGEQWHHAGMLERKQNVFDDFVAAAEWLIANGWTTADQLGICGESNGGLLVGAALTQRPELFAAAVCSAPVLDMIRYERFGLGPAWSGEYGTADDPDQFRCLLSYSPYHHVRAGTDFPAVLFTVFGNDSRVDPLHARKMCAALQWATASARPILLRHEDEAGHGDSAASKGVTLAADMLAFIAAHTGLDLAEQRLEHAYADGPRICPRHCPVGQRGERGRAAGVGADQGGVAVAGLDLLDVDAGVEAATLGAQHHDVAVGVVAACGDGVGEVEPALHRQRVDRRRAQGHEPDVPLGLGGVHGRRHADLRTTKPNTCLVRYQGAGKTGSARREGGL
jgi:prolyl oligopeptidase